MNKKIQTLEEKLTTVTSDTDPDPMVKIRVMNELAWELRYTDPSRADQYGQQVQELLETNPHPEEQAKCQAALSEIFCRRGDYRQALLTGNAATTLAEQVELNHLQPYIYSTLGGAHWRLGNLAEALVYFQQQYQTSQQLGDKTNEAEALNNIALIHFDSGDLDLADETLQKALAIYETIEDKDGQVLVLNNQAMILCNADGYESALSRASRALELTQNIENQRLASDVLDTIGRIYLKQRNYSQALIYFQRAIDMIDGIGMNTSVAVSLLGIGRLYALQSDAENALSNLHQALDLFETSDQKKELFECHQLLSEIYESRGNLSKALHHYKRFHKIKEQFFDQNADRKLKNLQISYEIETTRREAELHRLKNVELQAVLDQVKQLSGMLPICANCKKIRDDSGYWQDVAVYIREHSEANFSHGICPECTQELYPDYFKTLQERKQKIIDALTNLRQASIDEIAIVTQLSESDILNSLNSMVRDSKVVRLRVDNQDFYTLP